jgi:C6 transcription factor Pro1
VGALTDALCAIASRQHAKAQRRASLPADASLIEETQSHLFFNQGAYQLDAARRQGRCTQAEAMAAIHLISYSLVVRGGVIAGANASVGGTEWTPMLELACDWLAQTGMHVDENPRLFIMNMPLPAAYAAKVTMVRAAPVYIKPFRDRKTDCLWFANSAWISSWASRSSSPHGSSHFIVGC